MAPERRRSSFTHRRKSLLPDNSVSNQIPSDLKKNERLVFVAAMEALEKVSQEMSEKENIWQFTVKMRAVILQEIYASRTSEEVPRVRELFDMDRKLESLPLYKERLETEERRWNELLAAHATEAQDAQSRLRECETSLCKMDTVDELISGQRLPSEYESFLNSGALDFCALNNQIVAVKYHRLAQLEELADRLTSSVLKLQAECCSEDLTSDTEDVDDADVTPTDLLMNIMSIGGAKRR